LYVTGGGSNSINIENNIFANQSLGYAYYINTPGAVGTSDYNDIYSAGNFVAYWGADRIDLAALQGASGKETNSLSVYPHYSSSTDLHTVAPWLDGAGTSLTEVSDDVDGDARGGTPDIGADEFVPDPATTTPLAGSYTIGSGGDYASFAEAVNDVVLKGVSAPVSFDVLAGTYSEQVSLVSIAGSSAEDTVTFQSSGNAADVTLFYAASGANDNWVFRLYGADNVRIRNLTLTANNTSNPTYGRVIYMVGGVDSIGIRDNILNGSPTTSTNAANLGIVYATNSNYRSRIIAGNEFNGGSVGVSIAGINPTVLTSGTRVINNSFTNVRWGVDLTYHNAPEVIGNTIVALSDRGIEFNYCDGPLQIMNNEISVGNTYGIYVVNSDGGVPPGGTPGLIANNFIHVGGTSTAYGIFMNVSTYQNVYNNSVNITSPHATAGRALYVTGGGSNSINIENNIFANQSLGYAYYINTPGAVGTSDYNDLYNTGTNLAYWGGDRTDLAALQAASGKDTNSLSANPVYYSNTNLHAQAAEVDSAATPLAEVTDDIDGDPRDDTFPDIGADEFVFGVIGIDQGDDEIITAKIPKTYEIYQNYPNPFNPVTNIRYGLPRLSQVKIEIFNILGQKVRTLVNEQKEAGYYTAIWSGRNDYDAKVGSGIYIYRIQAGDFVRVKRMVLMK
jgi:hypothetical protein